MKGLLRKIIRALDAVNTIIVPDTEGTFRYLGHYHGSSLLFSTSEGTFHRENFKLIGTREIL
ncbi:hypothetical protein SDC9_54537 [bioreactor metagenome]|uniref:Uncharacterized protein n=1 Tax=bioreactor metagenome TaxID=1076179 RepID=A0A644WWC1_9ZZZZ